MPFKLSGAWLCILMEVGWRGRGLLLGCALHSVIMEKKVLWGDAPRPGCASSLVLQKSPALGALPHISLILPDLSYSLLWPKSDTPYLAVWHRDLVCLAAPTAVEELMPCCFRPSAVLHPPLFRSTSHGLTCPRFPL